MCTGGGLGVARNLSGSCRKESFLKRHPECKHKSGTFVGKKKIFKQRKRRDDKLIYYNEHPMGEHVTRYLFIGVLVCAVPLFLIPGLLAFVLIILLILTIAGIAAKNLLSNFIKEKSPYRPPNSNAVQHWE